MVFRLEPNAPATMYQTWRIDAPFATHWKRATCDECECSAWRNGWVTKIDEMTDQGQAQAWYIRKQSGRSFTEERDAAGFTLFTFKAGQPCFQRSQHRLRIERPEIFLRVGGDWRGNPLRIQPYRHTRAEFWQENMQEELEKIEGMM